MSQGFRTLVSITGEQGSSFYELPPDGERVAFRDPQGNEVVIPAVDFYSVVNTIAPVLGYVHMSRIWGPNGHPYPGMNSGGGEQGGS